MQWQKATVDNLTSYSISNYNLLSVIKIPDQLSHCQNTRCNCLHHKQMINALYTQIIDSCVVSCKLTIPQSKGNVKTMPD